MSEDCTAQQLTTAARQPPGKHPMDKCSQWQQPGRNNCRKTKRLYAFAGSYRAKLVADRQPNRCQVLGLPTRKYIDAQTNATEGDLTMSAQEIYPDRDWWVSASGRRLASTDTLNSKATRMTRIWPHPKLKGEEPQQS